MFDREQEQVFALQILWMDGWRRAYKDLHDDFVDHLLNANDDVLAFPENDGPDWLFAQMFPTKEG